MLAELQIFPTRCKCFKCYFGNLLRGDSSLELLTYLIDSVITVPAEAPKAVVSRFVAFSMDLNKASQKQIMEVQLIGEVLSKRIVKHRPFSSWAEVKTLAQIGDKRLQQLKAVFTIQKAKAPPDDEQSRTDDEFILVERTITEAGTTDADVVSS